MVTITDISTEDLVDPLQIGWVSYREGDAILRVKVIRGTRGDKKPFVVRPNAFRNGLRVEIINYPDSDVWRAKAAAMIQAFRNKVGDGYFFGRS